MLNLDGLGEKPTRHSARPSGDRALLTLQPPHHPLHPRLPDVGVNLGSSNALVTEQGLDVHQFGSGVE